MQEAFKAASRKVTVERLEVGALILTAHLLETTETLSTKQKKRFGIKRR